MFDYDRQIIALSIARACQSFAVSFIIIILPVFISSGQISTGLIGYEIFNFTISTEFIIGVAISIASLISSLGQPIGGRISDMYKKRKLFIILGLIIICVSFPFYLVIESYTGILVLRIIDGISGAIIIPSASALINEIATDSNRGENFGVYNSLRLIGFGSGPIIAGYILSLKDNLIFNFTNIEIAFIIAILFSVFSLLIVLIFVNKTNNIPDNPSSTNIKDLLEADYIKPVFTLGVGTLLLAASISIFLTLENAVNTRLNQNTLMFSIQFSTTIFANTLFQPIVGRISDIYGRKDLILLGFLILIPTIILQGFIMSTEYMLILRIIQGMSTALVFAPSLALVGDIAEPSNSGILLSIITGSFGLGIAIGPTLSGYLYTIGSFSTPFISSGVLSLIGLVFVWYFVPKK